MCVSRTSTAPDPATPTTTFACGSMLCSSTPASCLGPPASPQRVRDGQGPTSPRTGVGGPCPGPCRVSARPVGGAEGVGGPGTDGTVGRCPAEDPTATLAPGHEGGPSRTAHSTACSDDTAQLVVIGDRGLGGVAGLLIGSVAFALAAGGSCPVVIVRGQTDATDGPVVVGVDGSPISEAALAFAFEAAALRGAPLLAVHAWRDVPLVAVHASVTCRSTP